MTPQEFQIALPKLDYWIRQTLAASADQARTVASREFPRLPRYFSAKFLESAKYVIVSTDVPMPPLSTMGLGQFADFENMNPDGITYLDTFFLRPEHADNEVIFFHELIHVLQWQMLGAERFLAAYAGGLEKFGYRENPLEVMAYRSQEYFESGEPPMDVEVLVRSALRSGTAPRQ